MGHCRVSTVFEYFVKETSDAQHEPLIIYIVHDRVKIFSFVSGPACGGARHSVILSPAMRENSATLPGI